MAIPANFDPLQYIAGYNDLIVALGLDPTAGTNHWNNNGEAEGRDPFLFRPLDYVASYADLTAVFKDNVDLGFDNGIAHFINNGFGEGRSRDLFDGLSYIASYPDLIAAFASQPNNLEQLAVEHYLKDGFDEGRSTSFDPLQYVASSIDSTYDQSWVYPPSGPPVPNTNNPDAPLVNLPNGLLIYDPLTPIPYNISLDPESSFDEADGDLIKVFGAENPSLAARHYIYDGFDEGRPTDTFFEWSYVACYEDLITSFATGSVQENAANIPTLATKHWINNGYMEGRKTNDWYDRDFITGGDLEFPNASDQFNPITYAEGNNDLILNIVVPKVQEAYDDFGVTNFNQFLINAQDLFNDMLEELSKHYVLFGYSENRDPFQNFDNDSTGLAGAIASLEAKVTPFIVL